jgi:uncharacterized protein
MNDDQGARTGMQEKQERLGAWLKKAGRVAVAFSGGLDSTYLAASALAVLGRDNVLAFTARSPVFAEEEMRGAEEVAAKLGLQHRFVELDMLADRQFRSNPPDRCYHCKYQLFTALLALAREAGGFVLVEGTTADDLSDYRPGRKALAELAVASPLLEAGLCKTELRALSRAMGLPTADKPSGACLASRIPYGMSVTKEKLLAVDAAEQAIRRLGFRQVRVRHHGDVARIELEPAALVKLADAEWRGKVSAACKKAGFRYAALDLDGYRTGSLNEVLPAEPRTLNPEP